MDNRLPLQSGTTVGGDYRIEKVLGAGGFGITYLAHDDKLDVKVAIKEYFPASLSVREDGSTIQPLPSQGGADFAWGLDRFLAEAQTLARLRHTNIVRVSRYFQENETAYMVLGFVEGEDYETYLQNLGRAPTQDELDALSRSVLDALQTIHAADLVHRDIKPQNIFIRAGDSQPILLDFGAARQALGEHSRATAAFVSPGYSPSESHVNEAKDQGPWTDIYAFAATLYRALVGRPPAQVMSRVSHDTYIPLAKKLPNPDDYRPTFLSAVDQALNVRREERPQSVDEWRAQLFADPNDIPTIVSRPEDTKVLPDPGATVIADQPTRVVAPPRGRGSGADSATTVAAPPPPPRDDKPAGNKGLRWLMAAGGIVIAVFGLVQIYNSFQSGPQPSQVQQPPSAPPTTRTTSTPQPQQPPSLQPMGPASNDNQAASGTIFASDPSLRRLATASWLSSGIQNGYWTGVTTGSNGTGLYLQCRGTNDVRRDSIIELENVPTGNRPLSGNHEVHAQIGSYTDNAVLTFNSANGLSRGIVSVSETPQTAGQFLNFLHQVFLGSQMTLTIPSIGYREEFQLNGAEEALNVCFGADTAQRWRAMVPQAGVAGGEVRKSNGAVMAIRCDTTASTRGNSVVVFSRPFNGSVASQSRSVEINIGGVTTAGQFFVRTKGNAISGVLYHRVADDAARQSIRAFLAQVRRSNQITFTSSNPSFSETFPLQGSSAALSGCNNL